MTDTFKITIHLVSSLDGMIARKDNSVSWFDTASHYEKGIDLSEQTAEDFLKTIGCYIMGAKTYEHALELSRSYGWPYGETPTFVLTHKVLPVERPNVELFSGDLNQFVNERLKPNYSTAWVVGGASIARDFIRLRLAHEIRLSILPILLGDGLPLFEGLQLEQALNLKNVTAYKSGMVELHYELRKH